MSARIFISYRRADAAVEAERLADALRWSTNAERVFLDIESISAGEHFPARLEREVREADLLLLVIGPTWTSVTGPDGRRRLEDPDDWVRREVVTALEHGVAVVPILVGGAEQPRYTDLPEELRRLPEGAWPELRHGRPWSRDVDDVIDSLPGVLRWERAGGAITVSDTQVPSPEQRILATTVDAVLFGLIWLAFAGIGDLVKMPELSTIGMGVAILLWLAVSSRMLGASGSAAGQSVGRRLLGLRVVRTDGQPLTTRDGLVRCLAKLVSVIGWPYLVVVAIRRRLRPDIPRQPLLHDRVAGTRVIRG